jgi:hypothetical protein
MGRFKVANCDLKRADRRAWSAPQIPSHDRLSRDTRSQLQQVFDALRELMAPPDPPRRPIGFVTPEDASKKRPTPAGSGA